MSDTETLVQIDNIVQSWYDQSVIDQIRHYQEPWEALDAIKILLDEYYRREAAENA